MSNLDKAIAVAARQFADPYASHHVMVARDCNQLRGFRHNVLRQDAGGLYIRYGKRGQIKKYLSDMAGAQLIPLTDGHDPLVVFHLYDWR